MLREGGRRLRRALHGVGAADIQLPDEVLRGRYTLRLWRAMKDAEIAQLSRAWLAIPARDYAF